MEQGMLKIYQLVNGTTYISRIKELKSIKAKDLYTLQTIADSKGQPVTSLYRFDEIILSDDPNTIISLEDSTIAYSYAMENNDLAISLEKTDQRIEESKTNLVEA